MAHVSTILNNLLYVLFTLIGSRYGDIYFNQDYKECKSFVDTPVKKIALYLNLVPIVSRFIIFYLQLFEWIAMLNIIIYEHNRKVEEL